METVRVKVLVLENDVEVGQTKINYFVGQPYVVKIDTPDGVDAQIERVAHVEKATV